MPSFEAWGARTWWRIGPTASLNLEGTRSDPGTGGAPEHGFVLRLELRWQGPGSGPVSGPRPGRLAGGPDREGPRGGLRGPPAGQVARWRDFGGARPVLEALLAHGPFDDGRRGVAVPGVLGAGEDVEVNVWVDPPAAHGGSIAEKGEMTERQVNWWQCSRGESGRREKASHHLHPESWAAIREDGGQALTGARAGGAIEHRKGR